MTGEKNVVKFTPKLRKRKKAKTGPVCQVLDFEYTALMIFTRSIFWRYDAIRKLTSHSKTGLSLITAAEVLKSHVPAYTKQDIICNRMLKHLIKLDRPDHSKEKYPKVITDLLAKYKSKLPLADPNDLTSCLAPKPSLELEAYELMVKADVKFITKQNITNKILDIIDEEYYNSYGELPCYDNIDDNVQAVISSNWLAYLQRKDVFFSIDYMTLCETKHAEAKIRAYIT